MILGMSQSNSGGIPELPLLNGAADLGKGHVGAGSDEPDGSHHDHENDGAHDRIPRDVLSLLVTPKLV